MSKSTPSPAPEARQWPLVFAIFFLVMSSILYKRLGNDRISLILAVLAIVMPVVGFSLRSFLSSSKTPRVRRVLVAERPSRMSNITLESAKYCTPPPRSGLGATEQDAVQVWLRGGT